MKNFDNIFENKYKYSRKTIFFFFQNCRTFRKQNFRKFQFFVVFIFFSSRKPRPGSGLPRWSAQYKRHCGHADSGSDHEGGWSGLFNS